MSSIITFISGKGGSGKTVTSSAIGQFLAGLGFKVLLVDTDASTNGLTLFFLTEVNTSKKRQHSLFRQVSYWRAVLPNMRDAWFDPA